MPSVLRANCLIVGDSTVGKTSICQVFQNNNSQFPKNYAMTTSVDISSKLISLPELQTNVEIFLLDTSGRDIFYELNTKQIDKVDMLMLVYDVTKPESFNSISRWLDITHKSGNIPKILAANKIDLDPRRCVTEEMGSQVALSNHMHYIECSAKEMQNIMEMFQYLACEFVKKGSAGRSNVPSNGGNGPRYDNDDHHHRDNHRNHDEDDED